MISYKSMISHNPIIKQHNLTIFVNFMVYVCMVLFHAVAVGEPLKSEIGTYIRLKSTLINGLWMEGDLSKGEL